MHGLRICARLNGFLLAGGALAVIAAAVSVPARAEDKTSATYVSLAECGAIKRDEERLACFDMTLDQAGGDTPGQEGEEDSVEAVDPELIDLMQTNLAYAQIIEDRTFAFLPAFSLAPGAEAPDLNQIMRADMALYCPNQEDETLRLRCFDEFAAEIFLDPE